MRKIFKLGAPSTALALAVATYGNDARAQFYRSSYVEAECPSTASGSYRNRLTNITGYSGTGYVRSVGNTTALTFNNTSTDRATYSFKTFRKDWFTPWFRINTNNSGADDSLYYRIDGGDWITLNNVPAGSGWRWISAEGQLFGEGTHTLEIANREDGLNIDKFGIIHGAASPTGVGGAAYNCATPMYFETECRSSAWGDYVWDRKSKAGYSGGGYIEATTGSSSPDSGPHEVVYPFESGAATYNFYFRIHNASSGASDSWFYRVDNGPWVTMTNTSGLGSGFRWARGTSSVTLARGDHTIRVKGREAGLSLDKLAFIPSGATAPSGTSAGGAAVNCEPFQTMSDWDYFEVLDYADTHINYMATHGEHMLPFHHEWHQINGSGGVGPRGDPGPVGSGVAFLGMHRAMMNDLRRFAMETGGRIALPISTVGLVLPAGLTDALVPLELAGFLDWYEPRWGEETSDHGIASYLTLGATPNARWSSEIVVEGVPYTRLGDIPNLDTLGRIIGVEYHGSLHVDIGGTMADYFSPADPIFYGWHGFIDKLIDTWLATPAGQAWAAANSNHRFLQVGYTDHHNWNNADFAP